MVQKARHKEKYSGIGFILGSFPFFAIGFLFFFIYQYFNNVMVNSDEITELIGNVFIFSSLGSASLVIGIVSVLIGVTFLVFGIMRRIQ